MREAHLAGKRLSTPLNRAQVAQDRARGIPGSVLREGGVAESASRVRGAGRSTGEYRPPWTRTPLGKPRGKDSYAWSFP
jgi:hypothetical protein